MSRELRGFVTQNIYHIFIKNISSLQNIVLDHKTFSSIFKENSFHTCHKYHFISSRFISFHFKSHISIFHFFLSLRANSGIIPLPFLNLGSTSNKGSTPKCRPRWKEQINPQRHHFQGQGGKNKSIHLGIIIGHLLRDGEVPPQ